MHAATLTLLTSIILSGPVSRSDMQPRQTTIDLCIVSLIKDVDVPAAESGPLVSITVDEGSRVQQRQLLAKIDDQEAQLDKSSAEMRRDAAAAKAASDVDINIAQATYETAAVELQQRVKIRQSVTESEIRRLELARDSARMEVEKRKLEKHIAQITARAEEAAVQAAENNIARRQILSPIDGEVVTAYRQQGEWVNAGEPVFRVASMNRLRVEGRLSAKDFNPSEIGNRPVTVQVQLAHEQVAHFPGKVVHISPLLKAGDIYRVRAEVDNRTENGHWLLHPGATVSMTIRLE